jgi:ABC-type Fe3+-hydroxamate transport system substrate-binding protein
VEAVLAARPDLVLLYASDDNRPAAQRLRQAGIAVVAFKVDSIAQFRRVTLAIGRLVGDSARAVTVVDSVDATLHRVRAATRSLAHPTVFIHAWDRPVITIGGGSFLSQLVEIAGGRNIYDFLPQPSPTVTMEDVVRRDPDVVLVGPIAAAELRRSPTWQAVRAVREGHIAVYDTSLVARPSVKLGEAAVSLARLLHPGVLP